MCNSVPKFEAATPNTTGKEIQLFMASRRVACGFCDGLLMTRLSKICPLKKHWDDTYVRKRGGEFKSFPVGAPVVDCEDKLVGVVTGITGSKKNKVKVLGVQDFLSKLDKQYFCCKYFNFSLVMNILLLTYIESSQLLLTSRPPC